MTRVTEYPFLRNRRVRGPPPGERVAGRGGSCVFAYSRAFWRALMALRCLLVPKARRNSPLALVHAAHGRPFVAVACPRRRERGVRFLGGVVFWCAASELSVPARLLTATQILRSVCVCQRKILC